MKDINSQLYKHLNNQIMKHLADRYIVHIDAGLSICLMETLHNHYIMKFDLMIYNQIKTNIKI